MRYRLLALLGLGLWVASCRLHKAVPTSSEPVFRPDTIGYWNKIRTYRLANGSTCVDLVDTSHHLSRYTLIFQRYRWIGEAARPPAAELALRWLLAEPTATNQASLMKEIQLLDGQLAVISTDNYIGIQLSIDSKNTFRAINRLIAHLTAPRWTSELFYQVRDEMAARLISLEASSNYRQRMVVESFFWPDGQAPGAFIGSYLELMNLRPEDVKSAFRSLWFYCPKAHVLSAPHVPDFDALYSALEQIPNRQLSECSVPPVPSLDSTWAFQFDTLNQPFLFGTAPIGELYHSQADSMFAILPQFWSHVIFSELMTDLCQKRSLTCQIHVEASNGPRAYIQLNLLAPAPNTILDRLQANLEELAKPDGLSVQRWIGLKEQFRFEWLYNRSSPSGRHSSLAAAAGNESLEAELAIPFYLHRLDISDFATFHREVLKRFRWLYIGQLASLKPEPISRFRALRGR